MIEYVKYEEEIKKPKKKYNAIKIDSYVLPIIAINIIFFICQQLIPGFTEFLILNTQTAFERPWTLITTTFLHADGYHIFFNMYALLLFGSLLERKIGALRFLLSYLTIGFIVSLAAIFIYPGNVLGASGAVMGIIGMLIIIWPDLELLLFFFIPTKLWMAGILWFILDLVGVLSPSSGVANLAHIIGMLLGLSYGYYLIQRKNKFYKKFKKKEEITIEEAKEYDKKIK